MSPSAASMLWELHHVRALYFAQCVAGCCIGQFVVVYLRHRGLDLPRIGVVMGAIYPFMSMLGQPLWCFLADSLARPKAVALVSLTLGTGIVLGLAFVSHFWELALLVGGFALAGAGVNPLLDGSTMETLKRNGVPLSDYGSFRLWGGLGWGAAALAIGPMIDRLGVLWLFWDYAIASGIYFILLALYNMQTDASQRRTAAPERPATLSRVDHTAALAEAGVNDADQDIGATQPLLPRHSTEARHLTALQYLAVLLGRPGVPLFFLLIICMGVAKGTVDTFLFLFLQDLGASGTLLGVTLAVTVVSETPCFLYSGRMIARMGANAVVLLALLAYAARLGWYSLIHDPWTVMPAELLHGVTFSLSWAAMAQHATAIAPPGYTSTTQGLVSASFFGLGYGAGSLCGGFAAARFGLRTWFQGVACMCLAAFALGYVFDVPKHTPRRNPELEGSAPPNV